MNMQNFLQTHMTNCIIMVFIVAALILLSFYTTRFRKNPIKIVENRNWFFTISGIICLLLCIVIGYKLGSRTMNYSLEFTGGTMIEIGFQKSVDKSKISEIINNSVNEYNKNIANTEPDNELKTPTTQPEGTPRIMNYPNDMNRIDMVLAKKNGSLTKDEVKGLSAVLFSRFGKIRVDDSSIIEENGKVKYSFLVETSTDLFTMEEIDSSIEEAKEEEKAKEGEESKDHIKRIVVFRDRNEFEKLLASFNENLVLDSVDISKPYKLEEKDTDTFNAAFVRLAKSTGTQLEDAEITKLLTMITEKAGNLYIFKKESIGPSIGKELANKAILAVLVALALQLLYITIRFNNKWYYGLAADIGLFHDLVLMFGIYSLLNLEFDSPFVSAMMTIIGYSVMNSIVIFDRIRENLKFLAGKPFNEVADASCNQTMTRSVNTTLTVLITLFALYFFGGVTLRNFAFALLIGCTAGAYSSIFLVPSILSWFEANIKIKEAETAELEREAKKEAMEERRRKKILKKKVEESAEELPPENEDDYIDKPKKAKKEEADEDDEDEEEAKPVRRKRIIRRKRR